MAFSSPPTSGLASLGQAFASYLKDTNLYPGLTAIECLEREGRLLLLAQHPAPEARDPSELLRELEATCRDLLATVGLPDQPWARVAVLPVRIYLKLTSAPQPYAIHTFTWSLEDAARVVFPAVPPATTSIATPADGLDLPDPEPSISSSVSPENGLDNSFSNGHHSHDHQPDSGANNGANNGASSSPDLDSNHGLAHEDELWPQPGTPFSDAALALPDMAVQPPPPHPWVQQGRYWASQGVDFLLYNWSYGVAGLILLGSGLFAYALSRPCVVGSCDRLDKAAEFNTIAQATLADDPTSDDLIMAQSDLQAAIDLLSPVPTWSGYYETAQTELLQYNASINSLDALIQAKTIASQAAALSQEPPHPVELWVDVHLLWQQAIDQLKTVPSGDPAYAYTQQKLREYESNYSAIGRRIVAEEEAEANFSTAIQTAHLAQQRMETANSLAGWQLAAKEWQAAIKGLSLIPRGTMAYVEAQTQLKDYQQQLIKSTNRANSEEIGARYYHQAVQAARAAAASEAKNQWTLAVTEWRQAVANARQIPEGTILAEEGRVLMETYQPSLTNAEARLRNAVALQNLTALVGQLCEFSATPCSVREDPSQVQVNLSSQYAEPLRQAITPPAADGTFAFTNELAPEAQQLIEQIITASHQIDRQIAIYDARGGFVARYRPDLGGFIKN